MFKYSTTACSRNVCISGAPPASRFFFSFHYYFQKMLSKNFRVVASDQHAERKNCPSTSRISPLPRMISKEHYIGLIHYSEVHVARLGDLFKERHKLFTQPSVKLPNKLLCLSRLCLKRGHCQLFAGQVCKNMCKTTKCNDIICIP